MSTSINNYEVSVVQIPNKGNNFHAICTARIISPTGQSFSSIGEAFGETNDQGQSSLMRAEQCACERAVERMENHVSKANSPQLYPGSGWATTPVKNKRPVGGPITDKQKWLIGDIAAKNGKTLHDAESISQELYSRPISQLTTKEVTPILDKLNAPCLF